MILVKSFFVPHTYFPHVPHILERIPERYFKETDMSEEYILKYML